MVRLDTIVAARVHLVVFGCVLSRVMVLDHSDNVALSVKIVWILIHHELPLLEIET